MPAENYYCRDNFFKKMTDLESPKKNNDCYFYYYSTCAKGDSCTFRHEPSALGCETMCSFWKEGKCVNIHCNFRHMELRKNRKAIPCYWESQPVGCLKAHCPFMHRNPRPNESINRASNDQSDLNSSSDRKVTAVDSLVVNFEEESDNESLHSPKMNSERIVTVKTLEEIRLEKIQAESAAYYSLDSLPNYNDLNKTTDMREMLITKMLHRNAERVVTSLPLKTKRYSDTQLKPTTEKKRKIVFQNEDGNIEIRLNKLDTKPSQTPNKNVSVTLSSAGTRKISASSPNISDIKVKTLEEIRAERKAKNSKNPEENEVTSTSNLDAEMVPAFKQSPIARKKITLRRKIPEICNDDNTQSNNHSLDLKPEHHTSVPKIKIEATSITSTKIDEGLLLEDDSDEDMVFLKPEEELLKEIDNYLDD